MRPLYLQPNWVFGLISLIAFSHLWILLWIGIPNEILIKFGELELLLFGGLLAFQMAKFYSLPARSDGE